MSKKSRRTYPLPSLSHVPFVGPYPVEEALSLSLDTYGQTLALDQARLLKRKRGRYFNRITSWSFLRKAEGCELLRVDLTTAVGGDVSIMDRHRAELIRRVERRWGYVGIQAIRVKTNEGNGVSHEIWACKVNGRKFQVPQSWLSFQWGKIHGAPIVWIRRMGLSATDIKKVGRYFAIQYLATQEACKTRLSWSWRRGSIPIGRCWKFFLDEFRRAGGRYSSWHRWAGRSVSLVDVTFGDLLKAWGHFLNFGWCCFGGERFHFYQGEIECTSGEEIIPF